MKLHEEQLNLIRHLIRFPLMDYPDCLDYLDSAGTGDRVALSYAFRPLTKNGYLVRHEDGSVAVLKKGRRLFPEEAPLILTGGGRKERERIMAVSRMVALMERNGVPASGELPKPGSLCFIPSACWRGIAPGILSTTRFLGMLVDGDRRLAVYDVGDGVMEWQVRAEGSLFYTKYGCFETRATGMLLLCREDARIKVAKNIIRQTMWSRRQLFAESCAERNRPTRWSKSPIKLKPQYEHVYLTTPRRLAVGLQRIRDEEHYIRIQLCEGCRQSDPAQGDIELWPRRIFANPACDLLKYVYFFSAVKDSMEMQRDTARLCPPAIQYELCIYREDSAIAGMYPEIKNAKGVKLYAYYHQKDAGTD